MPERTLDEKMTEIFSPAIISIFMDNSLISCGIEAI
jgi:hypothetical protein